MQYVGVESGENNEHPVIFVTESAQKSRKWGAARPEQVHGIKTHRRIRRLYQLKSRLEIEKLRSNQAIIEHLMLSEERHSE
ncbi:hypothetical protein [Acidithiobacillus albertensis]|uniref:hypothetical protein n=1 Tax=Acidithiobacillus albertensis TaxID=119978 RepID=UPI00094AE94E|nr:hypothetical protein [Acidithiobacillus albertensis]